MITAEKFKFEHVKALDGLRAIAVIAVFLYHATYGFCSGGFLGVDLFFVLSGFLITSLLLIEYKNTGTLDIKRFYIRRALRLLPALICMIILSGLVWEITKGKSPLSFVEAASSVLFYYSNFIGNDYLGPFGHAWSLAIEEHFYFVWPLILFFVLPRMQEQKLIWLPLGLACLVAIVRAALMYVVGPNVLDYYFWTITRIDTILIGAALAVLLLPANCEHDSKRFSFVDFLRYLQRWKVCDLILIGSGILLFFNNKLNYAWYFGGFDVFAVAAAVLIGSCYTGIYPRAVVLSSAFFVWIGNRSYGIYLYHFPIIMALECLRVEHSVANFAMVFVMRLVATLVVSDISYRFIERPILRLKEKWGYRRLTPI